LSYAGNLKEENLAYLKGLPKLRILYLVRTPISDKGLAYFQGLPLTGLDLSLTNITDDGLDQLKQIHSLADLVLNTTLVTDAGLRNLVPALPNLRRLKLYKTRISAQFEEELVRDYPLLRNSIEDPINEHWEEPNRGVATGLLEIGVAVPIRVGDKDLVIDTQ